MAFAYRVSAYNRERKWTLFLNEFVADPRMRVLDVGYSDVEYSEDDNFIKKRYPYLERLTALGTEPPIKMRERYPQVNVIQYDGRSFPWAGKEFEVCWSNAVLEHVGNSEKQVSFLKEIRRVSRKAFVGPPNRWFPIETHTRTPVLHYFP
jgi:SAM-dependent methyltransferase